MGCIYSITNIVNNKKYIGQTSNFKRRIREHINDMKNGTHSNPHLTKSIEKYGLDSFEIVKLEDCDNDILDEREEYWISYYSSTDKTKGYNIMPGGFSSRGYHPDTSYLTDEYKLKVSERQKRYYKSRKGIGYGVPRTKEVRDKISSILKEKYKNGEMINPNKIKVVCLNDRNVFDSYKEAASYYNVKPVNITVNAEGKTSFVKINNEPHTFVNYDKYIEMSEGDIERIISNSYNVFKSIGSTKNRKVFCFETGIIYESAMEAGRQLDIDNSSISKCCRGIMKSCGGRKTNSIYTFKYVD